MFKAQHPTFGKPEDSPFNMPFQKHSTHKKGRPNQVNLRILFSHPLTTICALTTINPWTTYFQNCTAISGYCLHGTNGDFGRFGGWHVLRDRARVKFQIIQSRSLFIDNMISNLTMYLGDTAVKILIASPPKFMPPRSSLSCPFSVLGVWKA